MVGVCSKFILSSFEIWFFRVVSFLGDGFAPVLLVLALVAYLVYKKKYLEASIFAFAPLLGNIAKYILKNYFEIPRPAEFGCQVWGSYGDIYSFPSGHTIFATIFFGFLAYLLLINKKYFIGFLMAVFILLMGISRYLLGAHWALDVIGGYIIGLGLLSVSILIHSHFKNREAGKKEIQGLDRRNEHRSYDKDGFILKAGSVILRKDKVLVLYRASHHDYTLPKGHVEEDESIESALGREVLEETGLRVEIIKKLPDFFYEYHQGDGKICVKMFLTKTVNGKLRPEHKGDRLIWVALDELAERLSFDGLKDYVLKNMNEFKDV